MAVKILGVILTVAVAYLLGSISFAIVVSRALAHKDVREYGSGNAGLTNVLRNFGKLPAFLTLLGDFSKGIAAVVLGRIIFGDIAGIDTQYGACLAGLFVILGHIFPVFFGFKGGKGVLTTAGIALVIDPRVFIVSISVFLILVFIIRIVSVSSIVAAVVYPLSTLLFTTFVDHRFALVDTVLTACIGALLIFMHRANIKRLIAGTESKFERKKKE